MSGREALIGRTPDSYEVEFKGGRKGLFENPRNIPFRVGDHAVVDIDRGTDIGTVVREGEDASEKLKEKGNLGPILRRATSRDLERLSELREKEAEAHRVCQQLIAKQDLPMKLVDVEWQFDGNKIRFYFTSDHRVDFRKLVRDLAGTFKTRIEMRQIGVRDEARRLGGYGRCGRYYCCRGVIQDFDPVTLKMVKEQHLAPGSPKISGGCGRLMCCLRYERGFYVEAGREYPKVGTKVNMGGGSRGRVVAVDIFRGRVSISDEDGKTSTVSIEDFKESRFSERRSDEAREEPEGARQPGEPRDDRGKEKAAGETDRPQRGRGGGGSGQPRDSSEKRGGAEAGDKRASSRDRKGSSDKRRKRGSSRGRGRRRKGSNGK